MSVKNANFQGTLSKKLVPGAKRNALFFIIRAILFSSILMGMYLAIPTTFWAPVEAVNAKVAGVLLSLFGLTITINGSIIQSDHYSVQINDQCLAIDITLLLIAFVLAFPSDKVRKLVALSLGVSAVLGANVLRIIVVFLIGNAKPEYFDLAHLYFGQIFMIILLISLFIVWIFTMTNNPVVKNRALFILKLFGYSGVLFIAWSIVHKPFVQFTEIILESLARTITGSTSSKFKPHALYEYTFNFVTFSSLLLASDSISLKKKVVHLFTGNTILFCFQILFRGVGIYAAGSKSYAAYKVSIGIFELTGFLLPVLLWLMIRYWRDALIVCPICGAQKNGIEVHIRNKHGETALQREDVIAMFRTLKQRCKGRFMD